MSDAIDPATGRPPANINREDADRAVPYLDEVLNDADWDPEFMDYLGIVDGVHVVWLSATNVGGNDDNEDVAAKYGIRVVGPMQHLGEDGHRLTITPEGWAKLIRESAD